MASASGHQVPDHSGLAHHTGDNRRATQCWDAGGFDPAKCASRHQPRAEAVGASSRTPDIPLTQDPTKAPPPHPATEAAVRKRALMCLFCHSNPFVAENADGLLTHITKKHSGSTLEERHVRQLGLLNKRVCQECGHLRAGQRRQCPGCGKCRPMRDPAIGDRVNDRTNVKASEAAPATGLNRSSPDIPDATQRTAGGSSQASGGRWSSATAQEAQHPRGWRRTESPGHWQEGPRPDPSPSETAASAPRLGTTRGRPREQLYGKITTSLNTRCTLAWTECVEGLVADDPAWAAAGRKRCRL